MQPNPFVQIEALRARLERVQRALESVGGGGGGVTDHGALTGLGDDDHSQYHTDARGDIRYYTKSQVDTAIAGRASDAELAAVQAEVDAAEAALAAHLADTTDAHDASAISYDPSASINLAGSTDVQAAVDALDFVVDLVATTASGAANALTAHKTDTVDAHAASAISYTGSAGLSSIDVESALDELDAEKASTSHTHAAAAITVTDTGGYFSSTDVEGALQEVGAATIGGFGGPATSVTVTPTGIIIPSTTNVQAALGQVEAYAQNLREEFEQHNHDDRYRNVVTNGYQQMVANKDDTLNNGGVGTAALSITVEGNGIDYMWLEFWAPNQICLNGSGRMLAVIREGTTAGTDRGFHNKFAPGPSNLDGGHVHVRYRMDPFTGSKTFVAFQININIGAGAQLRFEANTSAPAFLRATWDR